MQQTGEQVQGQIETIENWRKRLTFRAWHRGTREMDLLIGSFADKYINSFEADDLRIFEEVLINNDPDVYDWIVGRQKAPDELKSRVLDLLLGHQFAK
ncbi:MAG TPA: succinate dehydrogenase assembly factor 2 [Rhodospirillaceae bacterium]|nr:succinate dehydrogenase assembly factor 2 [Rhodospirillaceae bacterium]